MVPIAGAKPSGLRAQSLFRSVGNTLHFPGGSEAHREGVCSVFECSRI